MPQVSDEKDEIECNRKLRDPLARWWYSTETKDVSPAAGYTIRVAVLEDKIALVAAFAPGFSDRHKHSKSSAGLRDALR